MEYIPTPEEVARGHSYGSLGPSNLLDPELYESASNWIEKHIHALHVVVVDDLEVTKVVPKSCLPHGNLKGK